jgi:predicted MPP superfamily phosphohydrolase
MILYICIAAIAALIILCIAVIYHDTHNFVVRSYDIDTDKISGDYTMVFLSDLHGYVYGNNNDSLMKAIDDIAPDAVMCAGDMFIGTRIHGRIQYEAGLHVLTELAGRYKVYMANGNHEKKIKTFTKKYGNFYDRYKDTLKRAGVIVLENDSVNIENTAIRVTGLDLPLEYFKKIRKRHMNAGYIDRLVGAAFKDKYQILIGHNPQYFPEYAAWGADLSLAGHVHGGIIRLPFLGGVISPSIALFPKYDGGEFRIGNRRMILSRGLGTHTIHVRMFNPGEVDVIRLHEVKDVT